MVADAETPATKASADTASSGKASARASLDLPAAPADPRAASRLDLRRLTWLPSGAATAGRWLSARVDEPVGRVARGAVVVAPSFDREAVVSFRTTRALADRARCAGFVALTFSWSGDGDSGALPSAADPARAWVEDLEAVVAHARLLVGADAPVHIVGLRLGASVLAALPHSGPGRRIYWEPVSGAAFLRNHALIRRSSVPVPVQVPGVELDGAMLTTDQAAGLKGLQAPARSAVGPDDLLRKEADPRAGMRLALGAPYFAQVPLAAIEEIVAELPTGEPAPLPAWEPTTTVTMTSTDAVGRRIEITESMCEVGPGRLPAIRTQSCAAPGRAAVLFTAMGAEVKAGPGSFWTRAARDLAAQGVVSLRADRGGIGDDADPDLAPEPRPYTRQAVDDVAEAAAALTDTGLPIIGVGVCAGAWALLGATGSTRDAPLREVLGVNVVHWHPDPAVYTEAFYAHYHGQESVQRAEREDDADEVPEPATLRERFAALRSAAQTELAIRCPRLRSALRHDVPLDLAEPLLRQVPRRVGLTLLYGTHDHRIFVGKGGRRSLTRARRRGLHVRVVNDARVDHSLFAQAGQAATIDLLRQRVDALGGTSSLDVAGAAAGSEPTA